MRYCNMHRTRAWRVYNAFISCKWCVHNQTHQMNVFVANMTRCQQCFIDWKKKGPLSWQAKFCGNWSSLHVQCLGLCLKWRLKLSASPRHFARRSPRKLLLSTLSVSGTSFFSLDLIRSCVSWFVLLESLGIIGNHCFTNSLRRAPWRHPCHHGGRKFRADGMGCGSVLRPVLATDLECWQLLSDLTCTLLVLACWSDVSQTIDYQWCRIVNAGHRKFALSLLWSCQGVPRPYRRQALFSRSGNV